MNTRRFLKSASVPPHQSSSSFGSGGQPCPRPVVISNRLRLIILRTRSAAGAGQTVAPPPLVSCTRRGSAPCASSGLIASTSRRQWRRRNSGGDALRPRCGCGGAPARTLPRGRGRAWPAVRAARARGHRRRQRAPARGPARALQGGSVREVYGALAEDAQDRIAAMPPAERAKERNLIKTVASLRALGLQYEPPERGAAVADNEHRRGDLREHFKEAVEASSISQSVGARSRSYDLITIVQYLSHRGAMGWLGRDWLNLCEGAGEGTAAPAKTARPSALPPGGPEPEVSRAAQPSALPTEAPGGMCACRLSARSVVRGALVAPPPVRQGSSSGDRAGVPLCAGDWLQPRAAATTISSSGIAERVALTSATRGVVVCRIALVLQDTISQNGPSQN